MKVIFLDFNGVLDTSTNIDVINYDNLQRLKYIVCETGAFVVISSSIKRNFVLSGRMNNILMNLIDRLRCEGISVVGFTPVGDTREDEIKTYLANHSDISSFVVIDDDYDMDFGKAMIKLPSQNVPGQMGLDDDSVVKAISVLGKIKIDESANKRKIR